MCAFNQRERGLSGEEGVISKKYKKLRQQMVDYQIKSRGIEDEGVLKVMGLVPRERFLSQELRKYAYEDMVLPISEEQTISQPYIVAYMTSLLQLKSEDRVLEVGTGSGYQAAILSSIAKEVFTIERHQSLAINAEICLSHLGFENVFVRCGNGSLGWAEHAPYDAIIVTAAAREVPKPLLDQLALGGCLVIPVGSTEYSQHLVRIRRICQDEYHKDILEPVRFVPLVS